MTKEEKELLLKDLCARLPYNTMISVEVNDIFTKLQDEILNLNTMKLLEYPSEYKIKPYLRPMSSMTEEEKKEIGELLDASIEIDTDGDISYFSDNDFIPCSDYQIYIDYLISHHFDYRGLIEKGLALEAPEDMYTSK